MIERLRGRPMLPGGLSGWAAASGFPGLRGIRVEEEFKDAAYVLWAELPGAHRRAESSTGTGRRCFRTPRPVSAGRSAGASA
ncbi:hypothetical protein ACWDGI_13735 [Streptomyces sp. NPDC001220]